MLTLRARGQAIVETAIALPVFLLALFGIMWAVRTGAVGERLEQFARYGGIVQTRANPYVQYSLYSAYAAVNGAPVAVPCPTPPTDYLKDAGPIASPAPQSPAYFAPTSATATCTAGTARINGASDGVLVGRARIDVSASSPVDDYFQATIGGASTMRSASMEMLQTPDLKTVIGCYPEVRSALGGAVTPGSSGAPTTVPAVIAPPVNGSLTLSCT